MLQRRGLDRQKTVSLDRVTLTACRLAVTGRPDRLIEADGAIILEERKSVAAWLATSWGVDRLLLPADRRPLWLEEKCR
jgi:hypothetical protein